MTGRDIFLAVLVAGNIAVTAAVGVAMWTGFLDFVSGHVPFAVPVVLVVGVFVCFVNTLTVIMAAIQG